MFTWVVLGVFDMFRYSVVVDDGNYHKNFYFEYFQDGVTLDSLEA